MDHECAAARPTASHPAQNNPVAAPFHCTACGHPGGADENAAPNIAARGIERMEDHLDRRGAGDWTPREGPQTDKGARDGTRGRATGFAAAIPRAAEGRRIVLQGPAMVAGGSPVNYSV